MHTYTAAAEFFDRTHTLQVGLLFEHSLGLVRDLAAAERWYRAAAVARDKRGMALLGNVLRRRRAIALLAGDSDPAEAADLEAQASKWWRRARKAGHSSGDSPEELETLPAKVGKGGLDTAVLAKLADGDLPGALEELLRRGRASVGSDEPADVAGRAKVVDEMWGVEVRSSARSSPFASRQLGNRREAMLEAVRREGAAAMRECSSFLLAAGKFAEFDRLFLLGRTREALHALHDALFEDEKAVPFTIDGPCSKVRVLLHVSVRNCKWAKTCSCSMEYIVGRQGALRKLAAAMTESADADERSRGLFILGASAEPNEAVLPLSQLCRESPSARASEMLGCMYGFLGEFAQVCGLVSRAPGRHERHSAACGMLGVCPPGTGT